MMSVRRGLVMLLLAALVSVSAGCGSSSSSSSASGGGSASTGSSTETVSHPNLKFALHAGLAFGAFHRYIYKPLKAGTFSSGIFKHKLALVKAGLAGLFAYHELKLAIKDAQASPTLSKLVAPVTALADKLKGIGESTKSGNLDPSAINSANGDVTSLSGLAKRAGVSLSDQTPSAGQVASGG